ncbi:hypothetical protein SERLA73DRAFT_174256 [Serpula lacrymans var. lacrymans S7.3]|uniref:Protein kinase domain-containing protein n=2 Tax=Serpula lacrymans var. lacrymans TaxID=341189 RepID=F8PF37_SERL3|nr:uncharacterized protein SERLADRAFT_455412 [Serpula lacrymans var. lacrymans S7.9]EGO05229.1 hypothetical protein SERLA73DRAFT_174256 [Serpula lacrymans var. lacrymans S7.3]EGO30970.1 hypothetical protein SERLADRAFT_455412 [Serpula lacrymans var. lacrymans S7.9]
MVPSRSISGEGTMGSDSTLRPEDKDRILDFIGSGDKTLDAKAWSHPKRRSSTSPTAEPSISTYEHSRSASHDGSATIGTFSDYGTAGLWSTPMKELLSQELQTPTTHPRPPLTVDTNSGTAMATRVTQADPAKFPLPPTYAVPRQRPRTPRDHKRRTFEDVTWAPRPPAEDVYNRLEEFFPGHDLDRPVIEASSGGTSPTAVEHPSIAAPAFDRDKVLVKGKKSIRIVAEEHKKRIDRTSRAESSYSNINRKRSTKLWDSRLVEVTTSQSKTNLSRALPDSPSGGPKPIFKWVRGELIGKGTYGRVYLALNATTGEMIAVKQVEIPTTASDRNDTRQASLVQALKMESETLKDLDHPNIVQYLGFEETPNFLSIFLEYVPGGSIGSCLQKHGKFDEEVTKSFTSQILSGLEYLHSKNILHRDLKADNILVETSGICKISDFGISKRTDDINGGAHTAMQGTIFWMAPEVINTPKGKGYNSKIDIWSVGCVVLEMWAGKRPWNEEEAVAVMLKLFNTKQPPPVPDDVILTSLAKDFKDKCFAVDPKDRPSAAELRCHPYLELAEGWTFSDFK